MSTHPPAADPAIVATPLGLARLALPLAASTGLGFFLHYVNRTVLAWHSPEALAASLPAGMLAWTFQGFFLVTCGYLGVFAAQHHGADERREAGAMAWPMFLVALTGLVVSAVLIPARHQLAAIFGTEPAVETGLAELLGWYLAEVAPMAISGGLSGFAGGIGRTGLVLSLSLAGAGLCIGLNAWLVLGGAGVPALGVTGAGIASLVTAGVMALVWLAWFFAPAQRREWHSWEARNRDPQRLWRFCRFAVPRGTTEILEMVAFVAFTAVVTRLGTEALAASNLAFNTYLVLMVPVVGFSGGISIAVGQAVGAQRIDLARQTVRSAGILLLPYVVLMCVLFQVVPELLLSVARHGDAVRWQQQMAMAVPLMQVLGVAALFEGLQWWWRASVQGAGDTRWPLGVLVVLAGVGLALPAWLAAPHLASGRDGLLVCYGIFAGYLVVMAATMGWRYYAGPWSTMSVRQ